MVAVASWCWSSANHCQSSLTQSNKRCFLALDSLLDTYDWGYDLLVLGIFVLSDSARSAASTLPELRCRLCHVPHLICLTFYLTYCGVIFLCQSFSIMLHLLASVYSWAISGFRQLCKPVFRGWSRTPSINLPICRCWNTAQRTNIWIFHQIRSRISLLWLSNIHLSSLPTAAIWSPARQPPHGPLLHLFLPQFRK